MTRLAPFARFAAQDDGAITVDWTVLAAAAVGMALATVGVLSGALGGVSQSVNAELFDRQANEGPNSFDFGADGWSGVQTTFVPGFGYVLGPISGSGGSETVQTTIDLPPGLGSTTIGFDVLAFDSLDGEDFVIYVDGHEVGRITAGAQITYSESPVTGIDISIDFDVAILANGEDIGGARDNDAGDQWWWHDSAAAVTITIDDPNETVTIGFGSTADQDVDDESWGVDNFGVEGEWPDGDEEAA